MSDHDDPEGESTENEQTETDSERPEIPADAMADMDGAATEVETTMGRDARSGRTAGATDDMAGDVLDTNDGVSMGEIYVRGLTLMAHVVLSKYGDETGSEFYDPDADAGDKIDTTLARELKLDEYVDELMAKRGRGDLPPGQALAVGTAMFALAVIATEPAILETVTEKTGGAI